MTRTQLDEARREAAEEAYQDYDFGYAVVDDSGWEYDSGPSGEWIKPVFFENEEEPGGPSVKGTMTIHFEEGSAAIKEAWATVNGQIVGNLPKDGPTP